MKFKKKQEIKKSRKGELRLAKKGTIVKYTQLCSKFPPTALLNFDCDGYLLMDITSHGAS